MTSISDDTSTFARKVASVSLRLIFHIHLSGSIHLTILICCSFIVLVVLCFLSFRASCPCISDCVSPFVLLMANSSRPDGARHQTYADLPEAAQRVPRSTLLHTICFKRISFPLTSRPDELWIVEVDHTGHEVWRTLEDFLFRFCPPVDPQLLQHWATSWREHFDIPAPTNTNSQESQYPVLPQPNHARATVGRPASWIPDHSHILLACWGRSANRFSQGDPSPSLLQPVTTRGPPSRSTQPEPEPQGHTYPTSTLTISGTSSQFMETNSLDDHL